MSQAETHATPNDTETLSQTPPPPKIPWEQRKQIGSFRAYWQTAKMAMFNPAKLKPFLDEPVCEKHAKKFRRVTVQLTFIITLGVLALLLVKTFMSVYAPGCSLDDMGLISLQILARMGMMVLSLIGLFLATRSLEWFSRPKDFDPTRQNRAITLSCYACGPILIVAVAGAIVSTAIIIQAPLQNIPTTLLITSLAWWSIFLAWWPMSVKAIHFTTGQNIKRTTITTIALPLIWLGQQCLVGIIPASILQWFLLISSVS
ncbi:MAG: hypothetical protein HN350_12685 [Phycisphaerales bacterium]|jgi:hypothetical protein|nr:hypothetical protein [Phycisphaerales bacterium]